uniref:Uncharacterized protein n=1 Tax=Hucho hucho TaxID=62062 RepID=A0A4W5M1L9_9TELE
MSFPSVRIGLYDSMKQFYTRGTDNAGIGSRLMAGCTTGAMAVAFAQPTDVVKVQFQAQVRGAEGGYNTMTDNLPCHFTAAFSADFITTIVASPVDVVKTRFMNCSAGKYSAINCAVTMMRNEGPKAFYKGFMPSFLRLGSWNIVMFVTYEQIKIHVMRSQQSWESPI